MKSNGKGKHIVVIGAGGNIGSHLLPHLARMPGVSKLTLIDPDKYDSANLNSQNISLSDVGKDKVVAQAQKLNRINSALEVRRIALSVGNVPLGKLRADLLLACLDSRRARMEVNRAATRLGVSWIDAGVEPGGLLARINVYRCGPKSSCLECSWDGDDYRLLEQRYSCVDGKQATYSTNAPSSLGSLAASLQALEARKLLEAESKAPNNCQVLIDAKNQRHYLTELRPAANCRNRPHEPLLILASNLKANKATLLDAFDLLDRSDKGVSNRTSIAVESHHFCRRVYCPTCGFSRTRWRLMRANSARDLVCPNCNGRLWSVGRDQVRGLMLRHLSKNDRKRSLQSFGLRDGDVLTLRNDRFEKQYAIGEWC